MPSKSPALSQTSVSPASPTSQASASQSVTTMQDLSGDSIPVEDSWRAIVDAIPDPAMAITTRGLILHHNTHAVTLFPSVRLGALISSVSRHPALHAAILEVWAARTTRTIQIIERVPVSRNISATLTPLARPKSESGFPDMLIVFKDLTEQDRLDQMRADFISNASHELRTPLASLRGYIETLQGPARDDSAARDRFLGIMHAQALRMTRLIEDLLSLSRVEMRVHLPPTGEVDLNEVAQHVGQTIDPLLASTDATLTVQELDQPARIRGDHDEIEQAILNLVQNAQKYGGKGVEISVSVTEARNADDGLSEFSISVRDTGPGIAPEHLPRLVERFYRAHPNTREHPGTGLGLAIVKHIVLRHRGELEITSRLGEGSCFKLTFNALSAPQK